MATHDRQLVSPSGIAQMTGLKMPTISNWRKRDDTFPKPAAGTDARPLFSLEEVKAWIKATGKKVEFAQRNHVWELADMLRGQYRPHEYHDVLLPLFVLTHWARKERPGYLDAFPHDTVESLALNCANSLSQHHPFAAGAIFQWIRRYEGRSDARLHVDLLHRIATVSDMAASAEQLMDLMRRDSREIGGEHLSTRAFSNLLISLLPSGGSTYADFGSGYGQTLLCAAERHPEWDLHGIDIDEESNHVSGSLLYLHEMPATLETANLLERSNEEQFDRITFHAPFGIRFGDYLMDQTVWPFGKPPRSASDVAWPQLAFQALRDDGHAAVVVAPGMLFKGGANADIIKRMVAQGAIEAVVSLPPNTQLNTAIPVSILLLQKGATRGEVLMVDVASDGRIRQKRAERETSLETAFNKAIDAVHAWRNGNEASSEVSIAVPLVDLMAPDAVLAPQRWLASLTELTEGDVESFAGDVELGRQAWTEALRKQPPPPIPTSVTRAAEPAPLRTIPELGLHVTRGDYVRPKADSEEEHSGPTTQVVTLKSVRTGESEELPAMVARTRKNPLRTLNGDVLVTSVGRRIHARVCHEAGLEVDRSVSIVRGLGHAWDADFVAQQLMSDHNQAMLTGVAVMRVDVKQLLLPHLPVQVQRAAGQTFRDFAQFADAARQTAEKAEAYVTALRNATASGTLTVNAP